MPKTDTQELALGVSHRCGFIVPAIERPETEFRASADFRGRLELQAPGQSETSVRSRRRVAFGLPGGCLLRRKTRSRLWPGLHRIVCREHGARLFLENSNRPNQPCGEEPSRWKLCVASHPRDL